MDRGGVLDQKAKSHLCNDWLVPNGDITPIWKVPSLPAPGGKKTLLSAQRQLQRNLQTNLTPLVSAYIFTLPPFANPGSLKLLSFVLSFIYLVVLAKYRSRKLFSFCFACGRQIKFPSKNLKHRYQVDTVLENPILSTVMIYATCKIKQHRKTTK